MKRKLLQKESLKTVEIWESYHFWISSFLQAFSFMETAKARVYLRVKPLYLDCWVDKQRFCLWKQPWKSYILKVDFFTSYPNFEGVCLSQTEFRPTSCFRSNLCTKMSNFCFGIISEFILGRKLWIQEVEALNESINTWILSSRDQNMGKALVLHLPSCFYAS